MSLFYHLLEAAQQQLSEKGFDEQSLNSPDKPGWLFTQLRNGLSLALRESIQDKAPAAFELKALGFFNDDKDHVLFKLHYLFDADAGTLSLHQLEMTYNKRTLTLQLEDPSQLPHSSQAISIFKKPQLLVRPIRHPPGTSNPSPPHRGLH